MKIIDIRFTQSFGWVIDVQENILPFSISLCVPMAEMDDSELFFMLSEYANTDPEHVATADPRTPEQVEMDTLFREQKETYQSLM